MTEVDGAWRIEFAVRDSSIRVWVRDHADSPVAVERLTGKAAALARGWKHDLLLTAQGSVLAADIPLAPADKVTAVLMLIVDDQLVSARFTQNALAPPALTAEAKGGRQVFETLCAACHGMALRGTDVGSPLLHPFYAGGRSHGDEPSCPPLPGAQGAAIGSSGTCQSRKESNQARKEPF